MMATSTTALVTLEEFRQMEDPPGFRLELHNGEVVRMTWPKQKHVKIQKRLTSIFAEAFGSLGDAAYEVGFRPHSEHELRIADVAWTKIERYDAIPDDDNLIGSPEIVVEILSPSNTVSEMIEKRELCLETGCQEFWLVDPKKRLIEVTLMNGVRHVYRGSDHVPVGQANYSVDDILGNKRL